MVSFTLNIDIKKGNFLQVLTCVVSSHNETNSQQPCNSCLTSDKLLCVSSVLFASC